MWLRIYRRELAEDGKAETGHRKSPVGLVAKEHDYDPRPDQPTCW